MDGILAFFSSSQMKKSRKEVQEKKFEFGLKNKKALLKKWITKFKKKIGGPCITEVAFSLLTQRPWVRIPALLLCGEWRDQTHLVLTQGISQKPESRTTKFF